MVDSFILFTVLTLIVAAIQILPKSDIIEIQSYPGKILKPLLFLLIMIIILIMVLGGFFEYVANLEKFVSQDPGTYSHLLNNPIINWTSHINDNPYLSTPSLDFFIQGISVIILLISIFIYFYRKNKISNISIFLEELDGLYLQRNFPLFFKLFESHYEFLLMIPPGEIIPTTRRDKVIKEIGKWKDQFLLFFNEEKEKQIEINEEVLTFIRGKFYDSNFLLKLSQIKPHLGVRISFDERIQFDLRQIMVFDFYSFLLKNPDSVLHREIRESLDIKSRYRHRYAIPKESKIIVEIFAHLTYIQDLEIINAFGYTTKELIKKHYENLRGQQRLVGIDKFNDREVDPILTGFQFFNLIVTEALYQKIPWHMWLYYYIHFIREICAQFPDLDVDEYYHRDDLPEIRYIHEIIYNLIDWIKIADDEPEKIDLNIDNFYCNKENGSIIKSSIICLSQCIDTIIQTTKIPDSLVTELTHAYLRKCFELRGSEKTISKELACTMARCFVQECNFDRDQKMVRTPHSLIDSFDRALFLHNPDGRRLFDELLQKTTPERR